MRSYTAMDTLGSLAGSQQALMMLGYWHQQDNDALRCRHGYRNKRNCPGCHSSSDYTQHVVNSK